MTTTTEPTSVVPADGSSDAGTPAPEPRRRRRPGRLSLAGTTLGLVFAAMSVTPLLVPRPWYVQAVLTGLCFATGYGIGAFLGWAYRALGLPVVPPAGRLVAWRVLAGLAVVIALVGGWLGRSWQNEQAELLGMPPTTPLLWLLGPLLGLVVAALLVGIGRAIKWLGRALFRPLVRFLPTRVAWLVAIVVTTIFSWLFFSGFLYGGAIAIADAIFASSNDDSAPGVTNPEMATRSGGPTSTVTWQSIGREGRTYVAQGPTAADIAKVVGDPAAKEPVRAYVGLEAAKTPTERAQLAVAELRALGGFDRKAVAVAGTTGSGWIDAKAANALEYVTHGDVATVTTQYSYLPSWLSYLADQTRAEKNAEALITAMRVELDGMPADKRPQLYVFGESLGAYSTDNAFTSVEDMSTTTDGALLIGPPSFDPIWQKVVAARQPGSPVWKPLYGDGGLVRVATVPGDLTDQTLTWTTDNPIIYLTHSSDPIVAWTADHSAWLDPRGPDVSSKAVAWPVVGGWQATLDQFNAVGVPPGHGHVYDSTVVTAWSEIVGPPSLPDNEIAAIENAIKGLPYS
jgi:uncharacterized membrane protein